MLTAGHIEINLNSNSFYWSNEIRELVCASSHFDTSDISQLEQFVHPEDWRFIQKAFQKIEGRHVSFRKNLRIVDSFNKIKNVLLFGEVFTDNKQSSTKIYTTVVEITPYLKLKQRFDFEKSKYKSLIENISVGVGISKDGLIQFANRALLEIYDFPALPFKTLELVHPGDQKKIAEIYELAISGNLTFPYKYKYRVLRKGGEERILEGIITRCNSVNQEVFQIIVTDITEEVSNQRKQRKLAADTLYINQKNKILSEIKVCLDQIISKNLEYKRTDFSEIYNIINVYTKVDKDWNLLKKYFEEVYPLFFVRLKEKYPRLTSNDIRHCVCIKMNLDTKETARLFNVKTSSIQIARVRLKKKMKLPEDVDLRNTVLSF
jgi:PAS domain S-box-containing protein